MRAQRVIIIIGAGLDDSIKALQEVCTYVLCSSRAYTTFNALFVVVGIGGARFTILFPMVNSRERRGSAIFSDRVFCYR